MLQLAQQHLRYHHDHTDGWITLAKKDSDQFKQRHYKLGDISDNLSEWLGHDTYFSQNSFFRPRRRIENIRELRSLYIDIDCYNLGYKPEWTLGRLELDVFGQEVPNPNYVTLSGRGLVLHWKIEPVPYMALPLWQAIQKYLFSKFEFVGADPKSLDASRVFRVPGSINSKNGNMVTVQYRHDYHYALREIQSEYLPELSPSPTKKDRKSKIKSEKKVTTLFTTHTLNYTRLLDLKTLLELRNYDVKNYREMICFLYRYWSSCYIGDPQEALRQTLDLNSEFLQPLSRSEVEKSTQSAEKAWGEKQHEILQGNFRNKAGYNFSNPKIIQMLNITEEEQHSMKTIISKDEKYRRNNQTRTSKRRESGIPTRHEYLKQQQTITDTRLLLLQDTIENNPKASNRELADILSISESYVRKLKKII